MDPMLRLFFTGFIRIHILYHASQGPVYGLALIEELRRHGYRLSAGTLYPALHALAGAGYLQQQRRVEGGRARKYYTITDEGRQALAQIRPKIRELVDEVLADELTSQGSQHGIPR